MKRVQIRPEKFVDVSDEIAQKSAAAFKAVAYTCAQLQSMNVHEPFSKTGGAIIGNRKVNGRKQNLFVLISILIYPFDKLVITDQEE